MRLLVTFAGGYGHLAPMLPVARAALAAGHAVAVAPRPALVDRVLGLGFPALATGDPALDPDPGASGLPLGADQPHNAARVAALGVGRVLDAVTATPAEIGHAVGALLADAEAHGAAASLRDECGALPPPAALVPRLAELAEAR
ncbi:MAG: hypothetical protein KDB10_03275 [Acidimicrobiales bacterium]|nr:hypothetical protein [Acidimicrobiales bacterium]MCB9372489.1 hypothetical protein [Microthrixaceae bacterium]